MATTSTQMDLEFATFVIQVDIKPQVVDVGIQVSLEEEISDNNMLNVSHLYTVSLIVTLVPWSLQMYNLINCLSK